MATLLLRLVGPLQSWGTQSRFAAIRDTGLEPSKSGVIGLLCAALGKPREERPDDGSRPLQQLAALRMGVRVDCEGVVQSDFQVTGGSHRKGEAYGVASANGDSLSTVVSERHYLSDARFLVGLESDDTVLLRELDTALARPHWAIYLGRKSFVPSRPVRLPDGLWQTPLLEMLRRYPWLGDPEQGRPTQLRVVLDAGPGSRGEIRQDVPVCFAERRFAVRYVQTEFIPMPDGGEPCISRV